MSFADVAEQLNPAVVSIDATTRGSRRPRPLSSLPIPDGPEIFGRPRERDPSEPRRGAGTGFVIDARMNSAAAASCGPPISPS